MKSFILKFWTVVGKEYKLLTIRIIPIQSEDEVAPYLFIHRGAWSTFIEKYSIDEEESSPDWRDYFKINVCGGLRLHVYSERYQINMGLPTSSEE